MTVDRPEPSGLRADSARGLSGRATPHAASDATPSIEVLRPVHPWECADAPVEPSVRSVAPGHVNQVRDPALFDDGDRRFLLYAVAGESGIAIAELETGTG